MTETNGKTNPGESNLVILLGTGEVPLENILPDSLGFGSNAITLLGDNSFSLGTDQPYVHYREIISGLDISQLEIEFSQWFKNLTAYLDQYATREHGITYQSVNLLLPGSLTIYLRLYEHFEEFHCARLVLYETNPSSVTIYKNSPDTPITPFVHALTYLASIRGIPVKNRSGESKGSTRKRNTLSLAYHAVQKEMGLFGNSFAKRLQGRLKPGEIFCVEENAYNIPIYLPAFEILTQHQHQIRPNFLINSTTLLTPLKKLSQVGISPYDGIGIRNLFEYTRRIRSYLRALENLFEDVRFREIFYWNGTDVWPLTHKGLHTLLIRMNIKVLWYLVSIDRLLNRHKPKAVITTYGLSHFRNTVIGLAKSHQIPTLILQNAAVPHQLLWSLLPDHPMLVWGQATKDFLVSMGAHQDQIRVVGPTKYNQPGSDLPEIRRDQEVENLGFSPDRPLILYTANFTGAWGQYYDWETTAMLARIVARKPDYQLIVTLHPRCPQKIVERVARVESDRIKLIRSPDMPLLYRIADVGVTQFSTTAIDASIYSLPIISVLTHNRADWLGMGKVGAALIARNESELARQLELVFYYENVRAEIARGQEAYHALYLNDMDGLASDRIYEQIRDIILSRV